MENHYFNTKGIYTGSAPANPGSLPPENALREQPPEREGFWPVVNATRDGWELLEDHRGEEGWVADTPAVVRELGPLPEGWSRTRLEPPDTRTPEEMRAAAYWLEADAFRDAALSYQAEAEAWRLAGNTERAAAASAKSARQLRLYVEKKEEIRARHSKSGETVYYLTRAGTYHVAGCPCTSATGEWLSLAEITLISPTAKACARCRPSNAEA